jgi:hypothetical protein
MYKDIDHCATVQASLIGGRPTDDHTFASINILADRLRNVQKLYPRLSGVEFSPQVQALIEQESILAIS